MRLVGVFVGGIVAGAISVSVSVSVAPATGVSGGRGARLAGRGEARVAAEADAFQAEDGLVVLEGEDARVEHLGEVLVEHGLVGGDSQRRLVLCFGEGNDNDDNDKDDMDKVRKLHKEIRRLIHYPSEVEHQIEGLRPQLGNATADGQRQHRQVVRVAAHRLVNQVKLVGGISPGKKRLPGGHLEEDAAHAPQVNRQRVVGGAAKDVRWAVPQRHYLIGEGF